MDAGRKSPGKCPQLGTCLMWSEMELVRGRRWPGQIVLGPAGHVDNSVLSPGEVEPHRGSEQGKGRGLTQASTGSLWPCGTQGGGGRDKLAEAGGGQGHVGALEGEVGGLWA